MSDDQKPTGDKTISLTKPTLTLKSSSGVKPGASPSWGGQRGVVVETIGKKKPTYTEKPVERSQNSSPSLRGGQQAARPSLSSRPQSGMVLQTLTAEEREARARALNDASAREAEDRRKSDMEMKRRAEDDARRAAERAEDERRKYEEEERHRREIETRRHGEEEARKRYTEQQRAEQSERDSRGVVRAEPRVITRSENDRRNDGVMRLDSPRPARAEPPKREEKPRDARPTRTEERRIDRPMNERSQRSDRPSGDRPQGDRPPRADRPAGDRPNFRSDRPQGDRPPFRSDRPAGERPAGDRPNFRSDRPQGDRPPRPAGERPNFRSDRPAGTYAPRSDAPRGDGSRPMSLNAPRPPRINTTVAPALAHVPPPTDTHAARLVAPRAGVRRDDDDEGVKRRGPIKTTIVKAPAKKLSDDKSRGRLTVSTAFDSGEDRVKSDASYRRRVQKKLGKNQAEVKEKVMREVTIPEAITIQELANRMTERAVDVVRLLMKQGMMLKITDSIDADTAQLVAEEMGHTVRRVAESDVEEGLFDIPDADDDMVNRAPIVTIMGHVDHGKTSLLDAIRTTNVVSGEAGGITQHIGAYQVTSPLGGKITFIDTPGHAAFTHMRARGAKVTDIVILVVAADDGVKPQTVEAISHAKAAGVPLIVAINKIDKPDANPQKVRTELLQYEIQVESLGGETLEIEISAKQRLNLDKLLEMIQIQSEMLDLKANPSRPAEGTVIEAKLDKGRGPVPTVLIERGTLKTGDIVVAGSEWGRVRALVNDKNETITTAGPSLPVEVLGFSGTPAAGDRVAVVESEARAREITDYRIRQKREMASAKQSKASGSLSDMFSKLKVQSGKKEFTLVIKGDVQGSVEAIIGSLDKLGNDEVGARVLLSGVGGITESDITLAASTGAVVIGFNVRALKEAREAAERTGVEIRYYNIIYNLVDDVKAAMSGMLAPTLRETFLGNAKMLEIFNVTKVGKVAGCQVIEGRVERGAMVRLVRDAVVIHEGKLSTLKRFKDEVKEVQIGQECGMAFENYQDMRAGDLVECYTVESIKRSL